MREWYKITVIPGENHRTICGNLDVTPKNWFKQYDKDRTDGLTLTQFILDDFSWHGECIGIKRVSRRSDECLKEFIDREEKHLKSLQAMINGYKTELEKTYIEYELD